MVPPKIVQRQLARKNNELVSKLHKEANTLFYDRMMYEINDALTSILAVCDVEARDAVPKIKQYIHRINRSLHTTKSYQAQTEGDSRFNINDVIKNLVHVLEDNYKGCKLTCLLSEIKAPVLGDQTQLEQLFLMFFVDIFSGVAGSDSETLIELRQKDNSAMVTILKDNHQFAEHVLEQVVSVQQNSDFKGEIQLTPQGRGVEVIIRLPLQFDMANLDAHKTNVSLSFSQVSRIS